MQKTIDFAEIQEEECGIPRFKIPLCLPQNFLVGRLMVGVDPVGNTCCGKLVEDRRRTNDAAALINVALLHPVEPRQQPGAYAALKYRPQSEHMSPQLLQQFVCHAMIEHTIRQEAKMA